MNGRSIGSPVRKRNRALIFGFFATTAIIALLVRSTWNEENRIATYSCVASASQALALVNADSLKPEITKHGSSEWLVVTDSEARSVFSSIRGHCDCGGRTWRWQHPSSGFDP